MTTQSYGWNQRRPQHSRKEMNSDLSRKHVNINVGLPGGVGDNMMGLGAGGDSDSGNKDKHDRKPHILATYTSNRP